MLVSTRTVASTWCMCNRLHSALQCVVGLTGTYVYMRCCQGGDSHSPPAVWTVWVVRSMQECVDGVQVVYSAPHDGMHDTSLTSHNCRIDDYITMHVDEYMYIHPIRDDNLCTRYSVWSVGQGGQQRDTPSQLPYHRTTRHTDSTCDRVV